MKLPEHTRRLLAYVGLAIAMLVGLWEVGPASDHRACVAANHARAEIKRAFHVTIITLTPKERMAEALVADRRIQRGLNAPDGLPQRDCSKVGAIFGHTFLATDTG